MLHFLNAYKQLAVKFYAYCIETFLLCFHTNVGRMMFSKEHGVTTSS